MFIEHSPREADGASQRRDQESCVKGLGCLGIPEMSCAMMS